MAREGCPSGIATAKPKREQWAIEELWDIVVEADPDGSVEETPYRGVYLLYAEPRRLARVASRSTPAFVKSLIVTDRCLRIPSEAEELRGLLVGTCLGGLHLRGDSKIVLRLLEERGIRRHHGECRDKHGFIEGVGGIVLVALGEARHCGYCCRLVIDTGLLGGSP